MAGRPRLILPLLSALLLLGPAVAARAAVADADADAGPAPHTERRVYDVRDLIIPIPDFTDAPTLRTGGLSDKAAPHDAGKPAPATDADEPLPRERALADLVEWVRASLGPDDRRDLSVTPAAPQGHLTVTATPRAHERITKLLDAARERRETQISVEVRQLAFGGDVPELGEPLARKFNLARAPGARPVELTPDEVTELLRAVQQSRTSGVVNAPRVTAFNGQRAYVVVANQRAYVAGYKASEVNGERRYEPHADVTESGVVLDVRATADEARTHAAIDLKWQAARLLDLKSEPFKGAPAGKADEMRVQVPVVESLEADATLVLPSGGTALVYVGEAKEGFEPVATPVLTKPPHVKAPREASGPVVLLVKPTVSHARDVEGKQAPPAAPDGVPADDVRIDVSADEPPADVKTTKPKGRDARRAVND